MRSFQLLASQLHDSDRDILFNVNFLYFDQHFMPQTRFLVTPLSWCYLLENALTSCPSDHRRQPWGMHPPNIRWGMAILPSPNPDG